MWQEVFAQVPVARVSIEKGAVSYHCEAMVINLFSDAISSFRRIARLNDGSVSPSLTQRVSLTFTLV